MISLILKMEDTVLIDMKVKNIPQITETKFIIPESEIPRVMMDPHPQLLHSHRRPPRLRFSNF